MSLADASARNEERAMRNIGAGSAGSYLVAQFREFHDLMTVLVEEARQSGPTSRADAEDVMPEADEGDNAPPVPKSPFVGPAVPPLPADERPKEPPLPRKRRKSGGAGLSPLEALGALQKLLERQALESGRRGGEYGVIYYRQAQYVMAVLADEIFLNLDWVGRSHWTEDLLETRLFGTYNAGDEFFRRLDQLLKEGDGAQEELAAVFLLALVFGFKGRYRSEAHAGRLDEYRRRLFADIYHRDPDLLSETRALCPDAYANTEVGAEPHMLPSPSRWFWVLGAVVVGYLVIGHWLWHGTVHPLEETLEASIDASGLSRPDPSE